LTIAATPLAILSLNCCRASLRATVRDPTPRLRVQIDGLGTPAARCRIDGRQVGDMPRDVAESLTLVRDLARSTRIEIGAVTHRVPHGGDHGAPELMAVVWLGG
jgi:hypothetical protein